MGYDSEEDSESDDEEPAYNENAGDAMVVRDKNAPDPKASKKKKKKKSKKGSKKGKSNGNSTFKYAFSDPYEVFKRDFENQFGRPYPGAINDFVDFNTPDMPPYQAPDTVAKNGTKGKKEDPQKKEKRGWFGRKKNTSEELEEPKARSSENQTQLAVVGRNTSIANKRIDPSSALVKVEKKNNRPTACETVTEQDGPITITKMKFTRPDGTVETVTMVRVVRSCSVFPNDLTAHPAITCVSTTILENRYSRSWPKQKEKFASPHQRRTKAFGINKRTGTKTVGKWQICRKEGRQEPGKTNHAKQK